MRLLLALPLLQPGRETVGSVLAHPAEKWLLGLGTTLGVVVMTVVLWPALRRTGVRLRWVWDLRHPAVRRLVRLSGWTVGYAVANQVAFWIVLVLSYRTAGDTSAYLAAFTFFQLPHGLFTVSVITVIGPELARAAIARDEAAFRRRYASGLRIVALVALPAGVLMSVLAEPIVRGALDHGGFREASVTTTAGTLAWFGIGLIGFSAYLYTVRAMYAHLDTRIVQHLTDIMCMDPVHNKGNSRATGLGIGRANHPYAGDCAQLFKCVRGQHVLVSRHGCHSGAR